MNNESCYDWIFLYWMPYDNDLVSFGPAILAMLDRSIRSETILVAVQAKLRGKKALFRQIITSRQKSIQQLNATDSSSESLFAEYLHWAKSNFQAQKWAIIVLGHGGCLDEISPDEHPEPNWRSEPKWMNLQKLSHVIECFNRQVDRRVELFFLQNCNKGTIEASYTFRHVARYTLSSQLLLGAPNGYYEPLFADLGRHANLHGGQLAAKIMEFEPKSMYCSYTIIDNCSLQNLPAKIKPLIETIVKGNIRRIDCNTFPAYDYINESFVDVIAFFRRLIEQSEIGREELNELVNFIERSLIYRRQDDGTIMNPLLNSDLDRQNLSGLSIFFPKSKRELDKYCYLPVFTDLKLAELFKRILPY